MNQLWNRSGSRPLSQPSGSRLIWISKRQHLQRRDSSKSSSKSRQLCRKVLLLRRSGHRWSMGVTKPRLSLICYLHVRASCLHRQALQLRARCVRSRLVMRQRQRLPKIRFLTCLTCWHRLFFSRMQALAHC